jgi:hypothetical protein
MTWREGEISIISALFYVFFQKYIVLIPHDFT